MNDTLHAALRSELSTLDLKWNDAFIYGTSQKTQWLPITVLFGERIALGVSTNAFWVRSTATGILELDDGDSCVFFLPVLEATFEQFQLRVLEGIRGHGMSDDFFKAFPCERLVVAGLKSESEYWVNMAMKWIECIPSSYVLKEELIRLSESGVTQRIRHDSKKLARRM
jgi:hypothetical protein